MTSASTYLSIYLGPLVSFLVRPDVTDLYVNRPGELWLETLGGQLERHDLRELDDALLTRLARQVASLTHQAINREHPLLAATLPDGTRAQFVAPPATRGPLAMALRRHVNADLTLADYEAAGAFAPVGRKSDLVDAELERLRRERRYAQFFVAAVRARKTILVSGGTSTGKTTFLNALLREISTEERLLVVEDTPELKLTQPNIVGLVAVRSALGETAVTTEDLLTAALRMRPDRIILGELRGREAFTFLRAASTGHPGSMTTIHANSPDNALEQLALLVLTSGQNLGRREIIDYARTTIDYVVQLERREGRRQVVAIEPMRG